jgi:hypothetical protein
MLKKVILKTPLSCIFNQDQFDALNEELTKIISKCGSEKEFVSKEKILYATFLNWKRGRTRIGLNMAIHLCEKYGCYLDILRPDLAELLELYGSKKRKNLKDNNERKMGLGRIRNS